ncbi:unnamed protein product [Notodromas monacha]|uniref:Uncharacterized protein n=1 Tax=Notodromas monacha TaxID=399045 RepID=A0A7R9GBT1_9CRUS|nr:unnamed protein product [Notodromas monacha]CAG0915307.1 unnamed protein product [Notodromas monacha]
MIISDAHGKGVFSVECSVGSGILVSNRIVAQKPLICWSRNSGTLRLLSTRISGVFGTDGLTLRDVRSQKLPAKCGASTRGAAPSPFGNTFGNTSSQYASFTSSGCVACISSTIMYETFLFNPVFYTCKCLSINQLSSKSSSSSPYGFIRVSATFIHPMEVHHLKNGENWQVSIDLISLAGELSPEQVRQKVRVNCDGDDLNQPKNGKAMRSKEQHRRHNHESIIRVLYVHTCGDEMVQSRETSSDAATEQSHGVDASEIHAWMKSERPTYLTLENRRDEHGYVVRPGQRVPHDPPAVDDETHVESQHERKRNKQLRSLARGSEKRASKPDHRLIVIFATATDFLSEDINHSVSTKKELLAHLNCLQHSKYRGVYILRDYGEPSHILHVETAQERKKELYWSLHAARVLLKTGKLERV